jgi:hypothetical protein
MYIVNLGESRVRGTMISHLQDPIGLFFACQPRAPLSASASAVNVFFPVCSLLRAQPVVPEHHVCGREEDL